MAECLWRMHLPELSTIHDRFLSLSQTSRDPGRESLGGKLLLRPLLDADGIAVLVAASIAGAASLCVDAEADRLREGLRGGFVDFVVSTLDEALRILKNEIRRARPISVGLTGDPQSCIDAMIERGLQPDLLSAIPERQANIFLERGAISLPLQIPPEPDTSLLQWSIVKDATGAMPQHRRTRFSLARFGTQRHRGSPPLARAIAALSRAILRDAAMPAHDRNGNRRFSATRAR